MKRVEVCRRKLIDKLNKSGTEEDFVLIDIVRRAKICNYWGCDGSRINIGECGNFSEFASLIFHESGHYLGIDYEIDDEKKCYDFSKEVCNRLGIKYDSQLEKFGLDFVNINSKFNQEQIQEKIDLIPRQYKVALCLTSREI